MNIDPVRKTYLSYILTVIKIIVVCVLAGFIVDYFILSPRRLARLADDYNILVDKFNQAVTNHTLAFVQIGSRVDNMPISVYLPTLSGTTKQIDTGITLLDNDGQMVHDLEVKGVYINGLVFVSSVESTVSSDGSTLQKKQKSLKTDIDSITGNVDKITSHPATWIEANVIPADTVFKLVGNSAGNFQLQGASINEVNILQYKPLNHVEYYPNAFGSNEFDVSHKQII